MPKRIPQPPVDRNSRPAERHEFWPGFVVALLGGLALVGGLRRVTGVETVDGSAAWETQLVKAFSSGGLQYADVTGLTGQGVPNDPAAAAAALEKWEQLKAGGARMRWRVRVNVGASTPCPT